MPITTAARRLARKHNALPPEYSGVIVEANLQNGDLNPVMIARFACDQRAEELIVKDGWCYLRVSYGRLSYKAAQELIDTLARNA